MKTLQLNKVIAFPIGQQQFLFIFLITLIWFYLPSAIRFFEPTAGLLDMGIWQLILLSMICFISLLSISWWLLHHFWLSLELPNIHFMVSHFKNLTSWQQLGFYWASFALLVLAGVGTLAAVI
ncbi:hypothetical protein [Pedobacter mucosus]|uniref:hypothetical protein n=1 Tax=Pedobacter mucosus TaxID=2895286 RepID=UPI001EE48614|nr:hypothetical protein [Pedobacter mucosus]UKT63260.1 hypothetical protein LOK61_16000 [Pedobacter mucosus]